MDDVRIDNVAAFSLCKSDKLINNAVVVLRVLVQNEEVLKKCAQEYLARVKQEEQRYQTLKIHAEEKLDKYVENERKSNFPVKLVITN